MVGVQTEVGKVQELEAVSIESEQEKVDYSTPSDQELLNAKMNGLTNAAYSNTIFGLGRKDPRTVSNNYYIRMSYAKGQLCGDVLTTVQATAEIGGGDAIATAGLTEAATTWEFGGAPAVPGLIVGGVSGLIIGHGYSVISVATAGTAQTLVIIHQMAANNHQDTDGSDGESQSRERMGSEKGSKSEKMVKDAAKQLKIKNYKKFKDYFHKIKKGDGRGGADNYTWDEILDIAKEYIEQYENK
jgi:hypothetical protein